MRSFAHASPRPEKLSAAPRAIVALKQPMQDFTFQLLGDRGALLGSATLSLQGDHEAITQAHIHLAGAPYFRAIEIRRGQDLLFAVNRSQLDALGRPPAQRSPL